MFHDTIHIIFNRSASNNVNYVNFNYDFIISKSESWLNVWKNCNNFPRENHIVTYKSILERFKQIGFNIDYLLFPDIKDNNQEVYCAYNYLASKSGFEVFFKAYEKILKKQGFNITFEYGTMINGKFYPNNMNFYSSISFVRNNFGDNDVIYGVSYCKSFEKYQIVNSEGCVVSNMNSSYIGFSRNNNKENKELKEDFFKSQKISVYLRKYKLDQLKELNLP